MGILTGVRILDLSQHRSGQMAARLLAEAGADVIKIEPPGGDSARSEPGYIVSNRSKRSVVLDLEAAAGRAELSRMLGGADVLIHDLGPTAAVRRGLDDATLQGHAQLIVCGITPFPMGHPDVDARHSESLMSAKVGFFDEQMAMTRREGPVYMRAPVATMSTWYLAAAGIVARLISRERDGAGGVAHTSLLQGYLVSMGILWSRAEFPDEAFARSLTKNNASSGGAGVPRYRCADDKWMYCMGPAEILPAMQAVLREMGVALPPDTNQRRPSDTGWYGVGEQARIEAFAKRTRDDWLKDMWGVGIPAAPCLSVGEVLFDEEAVLNEYVLEVDDPRHGRTRQAGRPFVTSPPQQIYLPAPAVGQHTAEVLAEDWSPRFVARGKASGRPPLEGCKVLDFGQFLSSPTAPMLMAHLGADVIKIEPTVGDGMRATPLRPFSPGRSFGHVNRGKRSLAADLKDGSTRPLIENMVRWADVFHHNVRYEATQRLGLDADALRQINPQLVYCHTSAYGHTGSRAGWPGFDPLMQGFAGWSVEGAGAGNPPMWHRTGSSTSSAAWPRSSQPCLRSTIGCDTGEGQFVSASLLGGAMQSMSDVFALPDGSLSPAPKLDANQTGVSPFDRIYQCNDRYSIAVLAGDGRASSRLAGRIWREWRRRTRGTDWQVSRRTMPFTRPTRQGLAAVAVRSNGKDLFYESRANQEGGLTA